MIFEQTVLPIFVLIAVTAAVWYGVRTRRIEVVTDARAEAFDEARMALQSLAYIAGDAVEQRRRDGLPWEASASRAYYFQRAANVVASIPASR